MRHLTPEQLIDVAEGAEPRAAFPHLASCEACDRQVAELRETMAATADANVPEPSPLFWDHFASRVRDAVTGEAVGRVSGPAMWGARWARWTTWRFGVALGAVAVLVLGGVAVTLRTGSSLSLPEGPAATVAPVTDDTARPAADEMLAFDNDAALTLLAALTSDLDWEAASQVGLVPAFGAADRIVLALDAEERLELQRILEEALSRSGA